MRTVLAFLCLGVASVASASLQITLRVGAPSTLPGLTPGIWLDVRNNGTGPAEIPRFAALQIRGDSGEEFIAEGDHFGPWDGDERAPGPYLLTPLGFEGRLPILQPNETKTFLLHEGRGAPWMCDPRVEIPGTYRMRVIVDAGLTSLKLKDHSRVLDQEGLVSPLISNEVKLTVKEPEGNDAAVWNMRVKRNVGDCRWTFVGLQDQILEQYPRSAYAQFLYPTDFRRKPKEVQIQHLERSIAVNVHHPMAERRRVELAHIHAVGALKSARGQQLQQGLTDLEKARELLLAVVKRRMNPGAQRAAVAELQSLAPSREEFIAYYNRIHSSPRIEAVLDCVQPSGTSQYDAWLYYHNSADENRQIPIGENNKFTPPPFDRGQPTVFARGTDWYFKVTSDGSDLMWHIDGTNLKISAKKLVDPPEFPDGEWEYWTEEKERQERNMTRRCRPGFEPDPEKLHSTALRPGEE